MATLKRFNERRLTIVNYPKTAQLFVYGIFLDQINRDSYFMFNPRYATVQGYVTRGNRVVTAYPSSNPSDCLTGLLVDILDTPENWRMLDGLEFGYDRITIKTTCNNEAFMYVARSTEYTPEREHDNAFVERA